MAEAGPSDVRAEASGKKAGVKTEAETEKSLDTQRNMPVITHQQFAYPTCSQ